MTKSAKIAVGLLIAAVAAGVFYKKVYIPKSTYDIVHPLKGETKVTVFGIGELSAEKIYPAGSGTGGRIIEVDTDQGRYIKKGDVIARLDPVDLANKLKSARASLQRAGIDIKSAQKEYISAKAQAELARNSYESDLQVYRAKGISTLAFEKSETEMTASKMQAEAAKSKIDSLKIRLVEINEEIAGLQKRIEDMTIRSPVDGYVIEKNVETGQGVPPAFAMVKIVDPKTLWIKTWIDERISGRVKVGQSASIVLRSRSKMPYQGIVRRIAVMSDPVTEEREVDVGFVKIPKPFHINEQAEVTIAVETLKGLYKVPLNLIVTQDSKKGIWVNKNGRANFKELDIVAQDGEYAGVKSGIDEEVSIIVPDKKKKPLFEGSSVSS